MAGARTIRILARQTIRWATASIQDSEPIVAVLHANYASGFAQALRQVASDSAIQRATGLDAQALEARVVAIQDRVTERLMARCPKLRPRLPVAVPGRLREGLIGLPRRSPLIDLAEQSRINPRPIARANGGMIYLDGAGQRWFRMDEPVFRRLWRRGVRVSLWSRIDRCGPTPIMPTLSGHHAGGRYCYASRVASIRAWDRR